jgi:hypothetical protein
MKNVKLLTAAALMFAAAGAYAGTDDGNVKGNVSRQVPRNELVQKQAPAPVAAASKTDVQPIDSGIVSPTP